MITKKRSIKSKISLCSRLFLCMTMVLSSIAFAPMTASAKSAVPTVSVNKLADVDVVLTVGSSTQDTTNYSADLKSKLIEKGIPEGRINISTEQISSFSSSDGDAEKIFSTWTNYPDSSGAWAFDAANKSIGSTQNVQWTGYWNSTAEAQKNKDIVINYDFADTFKNKDMTCVAPYDSSEYRCHPDPQGFTFRMTQDETTKKYSYYAFWVYTYQQVAGLFKVTDVNSPNEAGNGVLAAWTGTVNPTVGTTSQNTTCLGFTNVDVNPLNPHHVKIEAKGNDIKVYYENSSTPLFDVTDTSDPLLQGSYGPFTYSTPNAKLFNMGIGTSNSKTFNEAIREPNWRDESKKFIVNLDDDNTTGLSDGDADLPEILTRMDNEDIYYVGWGNDANKEQAIGTSGTSGFVAKNSNKGIFINRDASGRTYDGDIAAMANYIYSAYSTSIKADVEYLTYGSPYTLDVTPSSEKTNTIDSDFPNGKWKVVHDPSVYENNDGKASYSGSYLDNLDVSFEKPGRYDIYYANESTPVKTLYIHRKPVGSFSIAVDDKYNVSITDNSYDPDKRSDSDKGIAASEWKWKEVTSDTWTSGKPTAFTAGKDYLVGLKVQDHQGEWSTSYSKYSTSNTSTTIKPVADFQLSPTSFNEDSASNKVTIDNRSYDPAGKTITNEWTVYRNGVAIYGPSSTPKTDFSGLTAGDYKVSLRVKNSSDTWSETFSRFITINAVTPNFSTKLSQKDTVSASVYGEVYFTGIAHSSPIVKRGIEYRTDSQAVYTRVYDSKEGEGSFKVNLTGLTPNTTYYARSFSINSLGISKYDEKEISFKTTLLSVDNPVIKESSANDGSFTVTQAVYLKSGTFASDTSSGVTVNKLPSGLGISVKRDSDTKITIAFTGKAKDHKTTDSISNASITINKSKISGATTDATSDNFSFEFSDKTISTSVYSSVINEAAADDGSISVTQAVYLTNGIFASDMSRGVTVNNLPSGLGISVTRDSDTKITIAFTGKAKKHTFANNISNASVTIDKSKISEAVENVTSGNFAFVFTGVPATHTITFNSNGGSTVSPISGTEGTGITLPIPTKAGYTFGGWYRDVGFSTSYFSSTIGEEDVTLYAKWVQTSYNITGNVKDEDNNDVYNAKVKLIKGSRQVALATTDASGNFIINGVSSGKYNLVISKGDQTITIVVTVEESNVLLGTVTLPKGIKNSILEVKDNTPDVIVDKLNDFFSSSKFTQDDKDMVDAGGKVEIKLVVEKKDESGSNAAKNVDLIKAAAGSKKVIGMYLDLTLSKVRTPSGGSAEASVLIDELGDVLVIDIPLPAELQGKKDYMIYRYHGTEVQTITETANSDGEYIALSSDGTSIKLYTKKFSTYAIAYNSTSKHHTDGNTDSNTDNTGSGSGVTTQTITTGSNTNGKITISQDKKTATITPNTYYVITDVLVDGKSVGAKNTYTFTDSKNHEINAVFTKKIALPYYMKNDNKIYIGFSAISDDSYQYIAPDGVNVEFEENPKNFTDIKSHWAKANIDFVTEREVFLGTEENIFSPETGMSRAMFVTVIGRLYERSYGNISGSTTFSDVDTDDYYAQYVAWAHENGIIKGIGDNQFAPDKEVTREEMAEIMFRFATYLGKAPQGEWMTNVAYPDKANISDWAMGSAAYCQLKGIITGSDSGKFMPQATATRAEVSTVIERFVKNILD